MRQNYREKKGARTLLQIKLQKLCLIFAQSQADNMHDECVYIVREIDANSNRPYYLYLSSLAHRVFFTTDFWNWVYLFFRKFKEFDISANK